MLQKENLDVGRVPEVLNITHPQVVQRIQKAYIDAGADIICTCSFGVNKYKIEGCGYTVEELMKAAVKKCQRSSRRNGHENWSRHRSHRTLTRTQRQPFL